jgi:molybdopterin-guanine dinucleotide biosynthesis protein B
MPRVVVITGFRKSGKTSLIETLTGELRRRGHQVGAIKHTSRAYPLDAAGKDTSRYRQAGAQAAAMMTPEGTATYFYRPMELNEALHLLGVLDFVLLEGFKELDRAPRIIVARDAEEAERLRNGLEIAVTGEAAKTMQGREVPILDLGAVEALADLVEEKAMPLLPGMDCKRCGYSSCRDLARAALAGEAEATRCVNLISKETRVIVNGAPLDINPFVSRVIKNVVMGIVSTLKGVESPKTIEVRFVVEEDSKGGEER